jgi:hypothetical protein
VGLLRQQKNFIDTQIPVEESASHFPDWHFFLSLVLLLHDNLEHVPYVTAEIFSYKSLSSHDYYITQASEKIVFK